MYNAVFVPQYNSLTKTLAVCYTVTYKVHLHKLKRDSTIITDFRKGRNKQTKIHCIRMCNKSWHKKQTDKMEMVRTHSTIM